MKSSSAAGAPSLVVLGTRSEQKSEALGHVENPDEFFAAAKAEIFAAVGDLSTITLPLNRILLAVWVRPKTRKLANGLEIIIPDAVVNEDKWQGVSALVLKLGPHCYEDNDQIIFRAEDRCAVGDWVMFRRGEGFRTRIWGVECIVMDSERGIKMVLPRPDAVF